MVEPLVDIGGTPPAPSASDQFFFDFKPFWGIFNKIVTRRPLRVAAPLENLGSTTGNGHDIPIIQCTILEFCACWVTKASGDFIDTVVLKIA